MMFGDEGSYKNTPVRRSAPVVEALEGRRLMSVVYALQPKNVLIAVDSADPTVVLAQTKVKGLARQESLVAIDFRPGTGELYGAGSAGSLYRIDPSSGGTTAVGIGLGVQLLGTAFGIDFSPTTDELRLVSDLDQNLRISPDAGAVIDSSPDAAGVQGDVNLAFAATDRNAGVDPYIAGAAYTNNSPGAMSSTLYVLDNNQDMLVRQGSVGGSPTSADSGQLFTVGSLGVTPLSYDGFDIITTDGVDTAYAAFGVQPRRPSQLYTINLNTGLATVGGEIGRKRQPTLAIAVAPVGADLFAVSKKNELLSLNTATPGLILGSTKINGIGRGERIVGIDFRPADNTLFALTTGERLYTINPAAGIATPIGPASAVSMNKRASYGFDFNPAVDEIRVVNDADENVRFDPTAAAAIDFNPNVAGVQGDTNLAYIAGDSNQGKDPSIVGIAYTKNLPSGTPTTLYGIDSAQNTLVTQGSIGGGPTSPSTGQLLTVGGLGVNVGEAVGFDIKTADGIDFAYATFLSDNRRDGLYRINLSTGAATFLGSLASVARSAVDIAIVPV